MVALTVSTANSCAYCMGAHSTVAQMVRMPEQILAELRDQRDLSDAKLNALRLLVVSIVHHRGWVPEADLKQFSAAGAGCAYHRGAQDPEQLCESYRAYVA